MFLDKLNEDTYLFFAIRHYYNPSSSTKDDFYEDLKRFKYVQRHLKKYVETGDIKLHLLINHIIILYNVFDDAATPMLYYKSKNEYWSAIKTIQMFLERYPNVPSEQLDAIPVDYILYKQLREI